MGLHGLFLLDGVTHAFQVNRELSICIVKPVGQFYHAPIRKFDELIFEVHEQVVIPDEELFWIQRDLLLGGQQES